MWMNKIFMLGLFALGVFLGMCLTIIALFTLDAVAEDMETYKCWVICKPEDYVNVRKSPSKRAAITGYAISGYEFETDWVERSGFLHILGVTEYGDGWISKNYVVFTEPVVIDRQMTVKGKGRVALRKGVDGRRIGWIRPGQTLTVYTMDCEWAVTSRGFIRAEYLGDD